MNQVEEAGKIRTFKLIGDELGITARSAEAAAKRQHRPLPVEVDHIGIYCVRAELERWMAAQRMSYADYVRGREGAPRMKPGPRARERAA